MGNPLTLLTGWTKGPIFAAYPLKYGGGPALEKPLSNLVLNW